MSYEREIYQRFEKIFAVKNGGELWNLPSPDKMYKSDDWQLPILMEMKERLNNVKRSLSHIPLQPWRRHTNTRNPSAFVAKRLRRELGTDFINQAWCKLYETLCTFELVPESALKAGELRSVHLCEAPGGFVAALNHYLVSNVPDLKWDWLATSINPHHEGNGLDVGIFDDGFILQTLGNWTFGEDHTGNLTNIMNMKHLLREIIKRKFKENKKLLMVTADGGFDCQTFPSEQEIAMLNLLECEIVTAMSILDEGGNLVLKCFTTFEAATICLLYLLACSFKAVNVWKPVTSKEGNSELYIVAKSFIGREKFLPWLDILLADYGLPKDHPMFGLEDLPQRFLDQVVGMTRCFMNYQIQAIEENKRSFELLRNPPPRRVRRLYHSDPERMQRAVENHFLERYRLERIPEERLLHVPDEGFMRPGISQLNDFYDPNEDLTFSHADLGLNYLEERRSYKSALEKSAILKDNIKCDPLGFFESIGVAVCSIPIKESARDFNNIIFGRPIDEIKSSKFCHVWMMDLHKKIAGLRSKLDGPANDEPEEEEEEEVEEDNAAVYNNNDSAQNRSDSNQEVAAGGSKDGSIESPAPAADNSSSNSSEDEINVFLRGYGESCYKTFLWDEVMTSRKLHELMAMITLLEDGGSIMMKNLYPLLRKANVAMLYLIGQLFDQLLFLWPSEIKRNNEFSVLLHGYKPLTDRHNRLCKFLHGLIVVMLKEECKGGSSLLELVPMPHLINENFYQCILYTNYAYFQQSATRMMKEISNMLGLDEDED